MKIEVHCPTCKATLSIPTELGGDFHACNNCGEKILVPLAPGKKVGNFTLIRKIGEGGMGMVYLAEQKSMGRRVALKVLAPQFTRDAKFRERFEKEIKLQAALSHPNIATAYDAGHDGPLYYLAMEYIEGRGLHTMINKLGKLREKTALRIARQIAIALSYAWKSSQMVHRDIKPSNILVDDDWNVKILDMGVSKSLKEIAETGDTAYVVGTPQYMAPEQMQTEDIDHRADMYSLGATLYHMITGRPPYDEKTLAATISKMEEGPAPHPKEFTSDISVGCAQLIRAMMACKPENRYSFWSSLVADLSRVLSGQKPTLDAPAKNESYVAYSPRMISKDSPVSPKLAEVASRASSATTNSKPAGINLPALIIGILALLIMLMLYATVSQFDQPPPYSKVAKTLKTTPPPEPFIPTNEPPALTTVDVAQATTVIENKVFEYKENTLLELESLYQFILQRMVENPENFQAHLKSIRQLRIDADFYGFSKYLILADELEANNRQLMRKSVTRLIETLSQKADLAWEKGEYDSAQKIFLNYAGPLSKISTQERKEKAAFLQERLEEIERSKLIQEQLIADTTMRLISLTAENILDQQPLDSISIAVEQAIETFGDSERTSPLQDLKERTDLIIHLPELILEGFRPQLNGGVISISTSRGSQFVKVRRIERPYLIVERTLEHGVIEIPIHVDDLSIREKIIRLNYLSEQEQQFVVGILAIQSNHPQAAISYLQKNNHPLSSMLVERLNPYSDFQEISGDDEAEPILSENKDDEVEDSD